MDFMPKYGLGMEGCWGCAVHAAEDRQVRGQVQRRPDYGGPEYETIGMIGSNCG